ncbi:helix-turn-helix domain-containing protein [Treponema ruminis]|uniref:Transposase-like protein n=1 Tax=Treponema ruminis TaxID=744515 RepID=A0A7W8LNC9_9SPIR|nr:helix-turn-helix domain-containing protein [Treponema ruminis]MBB5227464.1 transposase-like protein [Treponema ruminis]QSI01960.1 helix-turn-helix domain-containing protein [Treponema ruminis]QSI02242.1 helix-turn-helix domain-containing protein [Treponema ruminis]
MNVSPATKAAAISDYMAGKGGYFQIAREYGISPCTLKKWVESPEKALNQASQKGIIELQSSKSDYTGLIERNELKSEEPEFRTKDAEIRYLRDKVAYLETLTELMGYNPKEIPKKKDSNAFSIFSDQDDVQTSPDSALSQESPENVSTNTSKTEKK